MPAPPAAASTDADMPPRLVPSIRAAACCAMLSAVTTILLWWLPRHVPATADFAATIALRTNPWYLAQLWVTFAHNWIALFGYTGAAAVLARHAPGSAVGGLVAFSIWATTELTGISVDYVVRLEQGRSTTPSAQVVAALARALQLSVPSHQGVAGVRGVVPHRDAC